MSQPLSRPFSPNPFARGYQNLRIERTLQILCGDDCPSLWRPLHPSQARLPDHRIAHFACRFNEDFALIVEGEDVPDDLEAQCPNTGIVDTVVHAVFGDDFDGRPMHVGDLYRREEAEETVRRLRFETGFYSRVWEISRTHLSKAGERFLCGLADGEILPDFLCTAFRVRHCPAIGVKLISTPWTDAHLMDKEGITAEDARREFREADVPDELVQVLEQAALADVRFLIFDCNAPVLEGLPVYPA